MGVERDQRRKVGDLGRDLGKGIGWQKELAQFNLLPPAVANAGEVDLLAPANVEVDPPYAGRDDCQPAAADIELWKEAAGLQLLDVKSTPKITVYIASRWRGSQGGDVGGFHLSAPTGLSQHRFWHRLGRSLVVQRHVVGRAGRWFNVLKTFHKP